MLGAMLGAGPSCITTPESQFKYWIGNGPVDNNVLNVLRKDFRLSLWRIPFNELADQIRSASSGGEVLELLVRKYNERYVRKGGASIWVDHTTTNLRYSLSLLKVFPNAKFIHIIRDGRAVAASFRSLDWGPATILDAANLWSSQLAFGLAAEHRLAGQVIRVSYENLVKDPSNEMKRICNFVGVPFSDEMTYPEGFEPPSYTRRQHALVGRKLDVSRVDKWQTDLSYREVEIFESLTGDLLPLMGYTLVFQGATRWPSALEKRKLSLLGFFRYRWRWLLYQFRVRKHGQAPKK